MSREIGRIACLAILFALLLTGCTRIKTDYGATKGSTARVSLNGFAALRESYRKSGFRNRDVSRLSDRVMRTDVIVWTPQILGSVDQKVTRWLERWLTRGGRTLVYIVPDSGSEADYWIDAARVAPPEQRLEFRKRAARSVNQRILWRLNRTKVASNGWFRIRPLQHRTPLNKLAGPWEDKLGDPDNEIDNVSVEYLIVAYEEEKAPATNAAPAPAPVVNNGPTGPGSPSWSFPTDTALTKTEIQFSQLIQSADGQCVVGEVTSEKWKNSRILVVAGGSLLTNYALTRDWNRRLAETIIEESTPKNKTDRLAGFLTSSWTGIPVSERQPGIPQATGMELLTVWPISLVTMHGVILGLVICLMLLPIFGRPKRIARETQSDFRHHLDAVAALMNKAGGESYARGRISEYMKRMHGETSGPWIIRDAAPRVAPPLVGKHLQSNRSAAPISDETDTESDRADDEPDNANTESENSDDVAPPQTKTDEADR